MKDPKGLAEFIDPSAWAKVETPFNATIRIIDVVEVHRRTDFRGHQIEIWELNNGVFDVWVNRGQAGDRAIPVLSHDWESALPEVWEQLLPIISK